MRETSSVAVRDPAHMHAMTKYRQNLIWWCVHNLLNRQIKFPAKFSSYTVYTMVMCMLTSSRSSGRTAKPRAEGGEGLTNIALDCISTDQSDLTEAIRSNVIHDSHDCKPSRLRAISPAESALKPTLKLNYR